MTALSRRPVVGKRRPRLDPERLEEICRAAELSRTIEFRSGLEARLYREYYVRTHVGVIDVKSEDGTKRLSGRVRKS